MKLRRWWSDAFILLIDAAAFAVCLFLGLGLLVSGHRLAWVVFIGVISVRGTVILFQLWRILKEAVGQQSRRRFVIELWLITVYAIAVAIMGSAFLNWARMPPTA